MLSQKKSFTNKQKKKNIHQNLAKTFHWFFVDIAGSSDPNMDIQAQVRKINILNEYVRNTPTFKKRDPKSTVIHWSGDGMAIGFSDSPQNPLHLAIELNQALSKYNKSSSPKNKIYTRTGLSSGPDYIIKDVQENKAFWGEGIVTAKRVMDLCENNQILASSYIADGIRKLSHEYKKMMHPIGKYIVKHGEQIQIYNIHGDTFGNPIAKKDGKIKKPKEPDISEKNITSFRFNFVELQLKVTNSENMMTHHKWIWKIQNIKDDNKALEELFYPIGGDCKKDLSDMNLKIMDEYGNKLKISSFTTNNEFLKEFYVKLAKPIKYKKSQTVTLEYDWEEPFRRFEYMVSSFCDKFKYKLTVPKDFDLKNRILKVNFGTKEKVKATPTADINFSKDKTEVSWESTKLKQYDTFEFDW